MKGIISLALQSALVIAGVLLFSYFDPFGILAPKKKTLQDTPVSVESIKEIGQLVTAEYYGEVLSSLHETFIDEINNVQFQNKVDTLNLKYIKALTDFREGKDTIQLKVRWYRKRKDLVDYFHDSHPELSNHPFYQKMIAIIIEKANKLKYTYESEGDILKAIWKNENLDIPKVFDLSTAEIENGFKKDEEELKKSKTYKKRQIIAIGRGWVKAGIDFGNFTEHHFKYDKSHKTIYLSGIEAKILDYDINPWFNAKAKIKGFEIIAATNQANRADYLELVKESCLAKLKTQAENAGIVEQAHNNAIETLKSFFSLLIGSPIDWVIISKKSPEDYAEELTKTGKVRKEELMRIDSILLSLDSAGYSSPGDAVIKIKRLKFGFGPDTFLVKRFSAVACQILADRMITEAEWNIFKSQCTNTVYSKLDSLWFFPYENYTWLVRKVTEEVNKTYSKRGLARMYDSLTEDPAFVTYRKELEQNRRKLITREMLIGRKNAICEAIALIEKNASEIVKEGGGSAPISGPIDSLKKTLWYGLAKQ